MMSIAYPIRREDREAWRNFGGAARRSTDRTRSVLQSPTTPSCRPSAAKGPIGTAGARPTNMRFQGAAAAVLNVADIGQNWHLKWAAFGLRR